MIPNFLSMFGGVPQPSLEAMLKQHQQNLERTEQERRYARKEEDDGEGPQACTYTPSPLERVSRKDIGLLKQITLEDVPLEKLCEGKLLLCRTLVDAGKTVGRSLFTIIEDHKGNYIRLTAYNFSPFQEHPKKSLPKGSLLGIINPYKRQARSDGTETLRIDNPASIVQFFTETKFVSMGWKGSLDPKTPFPPSYPNKELTAIESKDLGNQFFVGKKYYQAEECYSKAIELDPKNAVFYSNRAACYLELSKFKLAFQDTQRGLEIEPLHPKLNYRLCKALLFLRKFDKLQENIQKLMEIMPEDNEAKKIQVLCERGVKEMNEGKYNMTEMLQEMKENPRLIHHSDYFSPNIEIVEVPGKGRGILSKDFIPYGSIVMVSKAFDCVHESEAPFILYEDETTGMVRPYRSQELIACTARKIANDEEEAATVYYLHAPNFGAADPTVVDMSRIADIDMCNGFTWVPNPLNMKVSTDQDSGSGLWIQPSLFNHSCIANCGKYCVGDFMFVYTVLDIQKGEELTLSYLGNTPTYIKSTKQIQQQRNIKCKCPRCLFFQSHPTIAKREQDLYKEFKRIKKKFLASLQSKAAMMQFNTNELQELVNKIGKEFPQPPPEPDFYSILEYEPLSILANVYDMQKRDPDKSLATYKRLRVISRMMDGPGSIKECFAILNIALITGFKGNQKRGKEIAQEACDEFIKGNGGLFEKKHFLKLFETLPHLLTLLK
eukprot:TRINITY_DN6496_c0_g4_i1.p1 TRINITY_DN6496_c0_g4~~TRINITY_DN6496_c0_g4_i1.p1  ORF type:complete len:720 (-),score=145.58 TRINITY_DN6496_c0_g4_i1:76-2235(-)